jgi:WD40 repeat protein
MNSFTNENLITLIFNNYTLFENKQNFDRIQNSNVSSLLLRILNYDKIYKSMGRMKHTITEQGGDIIKLITLPNGNLISPTWKNKCNIWNLNNYQCIKTLNYTAFSSIILPNGHLAIMSHEGIITFFHSKKNFKQVRTVYLAEGNFYEKLFLLSDDSLAIFAINSIGDYLLMILDNKEYKCIRIIKDHSSAINAIENIANDKFASCSDDCTIKVWSKKNYKCL